MAVDKLKKRVGAWVVMDVVEKLPMSAHLCRLIGPIVESNFLKVSTRSDMPVIARAFEDVESGSRIKLVFFTTKGELDAYNSKKSPGFSDDGLRYFKWNDGWDLIYEGE